MGDINLNKVLTVCVHTKNPAPAPYDLALLQMAELFEEQETEVEIARMITEGAAYFDVEAKDGEWIRILCEYGDLIIIPAGRSYRMTTTAKVSRTALKLCRGFDGLVRYYFKLSY